MHSRIRATTSPKDTADNIRKQAYLLDFQKYSAFREAFSTKKQYPYSPQDLRFLTTKASIFLLSQFQEIYRKNDETILISNEISSQKRRTKRKSQTAYNLPTLGRTDITSMPAGYSTPFPPSFNGCDHCHKILATDDEKVILICGHGFHTECYNGMEKKCNHCLNYYKDGIWKNVDAFLSCLNSETNNDNLAEEENPDEQEDDSGEVENNQLNEGENLELDLRNKINEIDSW